MFDTAQSTCLRKRRHLPGLGAKKPVAESQHPWILGNKKEGQPVKKRNLDLLKTKSTLKKHIAIEKTKPF